MLAEQAEQWLNTWVEIKAPYLQGKFPDVPSKSCRVIMWLLALATIFHSSINMITEQRGKPFASKQRFNYKQNLLLAAQTALQWAPLSVAFTLQSFIPVWSECNARIPACWQRCTNQVAEKKRTAETQKQKPKATAMTVQWPDWPWCSVHVSHQASLFNYYYTVALFFFFLKMQTKLLCKNTPLKSLPLK